MLSKNNTCTLITYTIAMLLNSYDMNTVSSSSEVAVTKVIYMLFLKL